MELVGNRYGQWLVIHQTGSYVTVKCDCGIVKVLRASPFRGGYGSGMCAKCNRKKVKLVRYSNKNIKYD